MRPSYFERHPLLTAAIGAVLVLTIPAVDVPRVAGARDRVAHSDWVTGLWIGLVLGIGLVGVAVGLRALIVRHDSRWAIGIILLTLYAFLAFAATHTRHGDDPPLTSPGLLVLAVSGDVLTAAGFTLGAGVYWRQWRAARSEQRSQ